MMEVWFGPQTARLFSYLSLLALLACLSEFAKKGIHRIGVMAAYWIAFGFGLTLMLGAGIAFFWHQPAYVIFSTGFAGAVIASAMGWGIIAIAREYRKTEMRQSIAQDI
jgi:hypothetical protein